MQNRPHRYAVEASATSEGPVVVASNGLETLSTAPPAEYGGPGDRWSPETLLVAAVSDCFVLTFRAIARASHLQWVDLRCEAEGELDRVERTTRFTGMTLRAFLTIPAGADVEKAARLLEKAERACLITSSLVCPVKLEPRVATRGEGSAAEVPRTTGTVEEASTQP
jgi:organic hydroperoxide reductase OsmC/OhrA